MKSICIVAVLWCRWQYLGFWYIVLLISILWHSHCTPKYVKEWYLHGIFPLLSLGRGRIFRNDCVWWNKWIYFFFITPVWWLTWPQMHVLGLLFWNNARWFVLLYCLLFCSFLFCFMLNLDCLHLCLNRPTFLLWSLWKQYTSSEHLWLCSINESLWRKSTRVVYCAWIVFVVVVSMS